jgi:hypothetical protein
MHRAPRYVAVCVLAICSVLLVAVPVHALTVFFHDRALFTAALAGQTLLTDDYETYVPGPIPLGDQRGDFRYLFDPSEVEPAVVSDGLGGQALGGAPFDVFVGGNAVTLAFQPVGARLSAFGADFFYGPSGPEIPADTYRLGIADGPAAGQFVGNEPGLDLAGGSFFLGVIADAASAFTEVSLFSVQTDPAFLVPAYQVDNLIYAAAVPEPAAFTMLALGMILLFPFTLRSIRKDNSMRALFLALGALGLSLALVDVASAQPGSTPVRVINPATAPALIRDVDNPATRPFSKLLCATDIPTACDAALTQPDLPRSFVVPAITNTAQPVKQLVIEFVSGTCIGTARATFVEIARRPGAFTSSDAGDNFSTNRFPLAVAQFLSGGAVNGSQAFAEAARIYFNPGDTVAMTFDFATAGNTVCRAQLNGHFVTN